MVKKKAGLVAQAGAVRSVALPLQSLYEISLTDNRLSLIKETSTNAAVRDAGEGCYAALITAKGKCKAT
jgi:hypothetical protein